MCLESLRDTSIVHFVANAGFMQQDTKSMKFRTCFFNTTKAIASTILLPTASIVGALWHKVLEYNSQQTPIEKKLHKWLSFEEVKQTPRALLSSLITTVSLSRLNWLQKQYDPEKTSLFHALNQGHFDIALCLLKKRKTNVLNPKECEQLVQSIIKHGQKDFLATILKEKLVDVSFEKTFLCRVHDASPKRYYLFNSSFISQDVADSYYDIVMEHGQIYYTKHITEWVVYSCLGNNPSTVWSVVSDDIIFASKSIADITPLTLALDSGDEGRIRDVLNKKYEGQTVHGRQELYPFEIKKLVTYIVTNKAYTILKELLNKPFDRYYDFHNLFFSTILSLPTKKEKEPFIDILLENSKFFVSQEFVSSPLLSKLKASLSKASLNKIVSTIEKSPRWHGTITMDEIKRIIGVTGSPSSHPSTTTGY